jgi:sec-independent protein translocase protein TatC
VATVIRPVGHEDQMSLVEHLDELRTRLIVSVVAFGVLFAICFWQNGTVLDIVNHPFNVATKHTPKKGPLAKTATFQRNLGALARDAKGFAQAVSADRGASPATKSAATPSRSPPTRRCCWRSRSSCGRPTRSSCRRSHHVSAASRCP